MRIKKLLLEYSIVIAYFILAVLIEITAACITDGKFYIKDPRYMFTVLAALCCVLLCIRNQKARLIVSNVLLFAQGIINIIFMLLYEMAGQWFDWSMLSLRNDAMGILENVPVNFWFTIILIFILSAYLCFGLKYTDFIDKKCKEYEENVKPLNNSNKIVITTSAVLIPIFLILNVITGYAINGSTVTDPYDDLLHSTQASKYNQYGSTSNFINEFYANALFYDEDTLKSEVIEDYIYSNIYNGSESGDLHGISDGNNVVTILGETFEWMSFMGNNCAFDSDFKLPNGINLSEEKLRELYPNLWRFYDESYVLTNYHAREKTDISENYSILGNYPIRTYINYQYPNNVKPYSMPNMMKQYYSDENFSSQYFHNGTNNFYNRTNAIRGLGFDSQYYTEDMKSGNVFGIDSTLFHDYSDEGNRNRDDEMVDSCKDLMFPTDKKFYTYITTITMHGLYSRERENLSEEYKKLEEYLGIDIDDASTKELVLYTYMAAAQVTDRAIGIVLETLEERGLLDNTTIVLFGDHQGYYEGVSNYVKGIDSAKQCEEDSIDYMNLYRVPCMIYDTKLYNKATNNGTNPEGRFNNKFSSSCDIVPTLLDLLGISYYEDIYYGHSVFSNTPTVIYSRGYGYWLDTYSYYLNINNFKWLNINKIKEDNFIETIKNYFVANNIEFENKTSYTNSEIKEMYIKYIDLISTELVENIRYVDQMYKKDLFSDSTAYNKFINNIAKLNNW